MRSRALRMAAAVIGGLLGCWLCQGDVSASDAFAHTAVIHKEDSFDFGGVQFYQLALGAQGRITVSADGETELARWLSAHDAKRILMRLELTPEQERLSR